MTPVPVIDEHRLVTLINDPHTLDRGWDENAACADLMSASDHPYFPDDGESPSVSAIRRCLACPVADHCLAIGLVHEARDGYRYGWWGGYGPNERDHLARQLGIVTEVEIDLTHPAELARDLRAKNFTVPSIAAEIGCTERTVYRYLATPAA